jgi:hypothetical protein
VSVLLLCLRCGCKSCFCLIVEKSSDGMCDDGCRCATPAERFIDNPEIRFSELTVSTVDTVS